MKELGFSLEEIPRILDSKVGPGELRGMLAIRRSEVARTIERETERLRQLETRLAQIDDEGGLTEDDVVVRPEPERLLLSTRVRVDSFGAARERLAEVIHLAKSHIPKAELGSLVVLAHADAYEPDDLDLELGYFVSRSVGPIQLLNGSWLELRTLPAAERVATCVRIGPPERAHLTTGRIGRFVERNGYRFEGSSREVFLEDLDPSRPEAAVVEMQFPITR